MYELKDSHFTIFDTQSMIIGGAVIIFGIIVFLFVRNKSRKKP